MTVALYGVRGQQHAPAAFYPRENPPPYQFYRRLGGPHGRPGRAENLASTGIRSRTVQTVVSRYTDWATGTTIEKYIYFGIVHFFGLAKILVYRNERNGRNKKWIQGSGSMVLDQCVWNNKFSKTSNYMVGWQVQTGARVQMYRSGIYWSSIKSCDSLICLRALSKEFRQATFPRDGGLHNDRHHSWWCEKCKRNTLKKVSSS